MDARERGARVLTRTECVSARRESGLWSAQLSSGETVRRARGRERRRALGASGAERAPGAALARCGAPGQGQPHRAAEALRGRARLHPAERRPPGGLHDSLWRPHTLVGTTDIAGRGRARRSAGERRGSRLPVPRGRTATSRGRRAPAGRGVELRGRAAALRRRLGRSFGGHARLHAARGRRRRARRRCCRCSAARSPPTGVSPSTRWTSSRRTSRA